MRGNRKRLPFFAARTAGGGAQMIIAAKNLGWGKANPPIVCFSSNAAHCAGRLSYVFYRPFQLDCHKASVPAADAP